MVATQSTILANTPAQLRVPGAYAGTTVAPQWSNKPTIDCAHLSSSRNREDRAEAKRLTERNKLVWREPSVAPDGFCI